MLVLGLVLVIGGIILLPLPGPGWVVIFLGLGLLATEFAWAARVLHEAKHRFDQAKDKALRSRDRRGAPEHASGRGIEPQPDRQPEPAAAEKRADERAE